MKNTGLVLEGGGLRIVHTAGILDYFLEEKLYFPYVIGVSAGASNGTSYISRQQGRNRVVNIDYLDDPRYLSLRSLLSGKGLFGMDFIFNNLPLELEPFDFASFYDYPGQFKIGVTDCETGQSIYFKKDDCKESEDILTIIKASCSLPLIAPKVQFKGKTLLDGGVTDPIPIKKSIADGNQKNVIILTRPKGYRKEPFKLEWLAKLFYFKYPKLIAALKQRHEVYNQTLDYIERLEQEDKAFVIRPDDSLNLKRIEKDKQKLRRAYDRGYDYGKEIYSRLSSWLQD